MATIRDIAAATMKARSATGMRGIGTRVKNGRIQVVNVTAAGRNTTVDPLSDWTDAAGAIVVLNQIAEDKAFRS